MPDYQLSKVYQIVCLATGEKYIGSTTQATLALRLASHVRGFKGWKKGTYHFVSSFTILEHGNYQIELLEAFPCKSKDELNAREGHYIRIIDCVNKRVEGRTTKEWYQDNKNELLEKAKAYYETNKTEIAEQKKLYYETNKTEKLEKAKAYYETNKTEKLEKTNAYYETNKTEIAEQKRIWRETNKADIARKKKVYYEKNKTKILEKAKLNYVTKKISRS